MSQFLPLLEAALPRIHPPVAIVLGAPRLAAQLADRINLPGTICYQMDLFQSERAREEVAVLNTPAEVTTSADLWDLPAEFGSVVFPSPPRAERDLKIDMVEQAFHILKPNGVFVALSPVEHDQFYPKLVKKVFGKASTTTLREGTIVWASRHDDHPRRRHELMVQARVDEGASLRFLTRPGVFTYGQLDLGSRALLAAAEIEPGDRILDLGCGAGAVGIAAALRAGPTGHVTFIDSNLRAIALTEINARAAGLTDFEAIASAHGGENLTPGSFDVVLTNPPYYAQQTIANLFIKRAKQLLKRGGRFYLVTKQVDEVEPLVREAFGEPELFENRGYVIMVARK